MAEKFRRNQHKLVEGSKSGNRTFIEEDNSFKIKIMLDQGTKRN